MALDPAIIHTTSKQSSEQGNLETGFLSKSIQMILLAHMSPLAQLPRTPFPAQPLGEWENRLGQGVPTSRKSECFLAVLRVEALELQMQH